MGIPWSILYRDCDEGLEDGGRASEIRGYMLPISLSKIILSGRRHWKNGASQREKDGNIHEPCLIAHLNMFTLTTKMKLKHFPLLYSSH